MRLNDRSVILSWVEKKVSFYYGEGKLDGSKTSHRKHPSKGMIVKKKMKRFSSSMCELSHKSEKHAAKWTFSSSFLGVKRKLRRRKISIEINACLCLRLMIAKVFILCVSNIKDPKSWFCIPALTPKPLCREYVANSEYLLWIQKGYQIT